jgi:hypothetical protein
MKLRIAPGSFLSGVLFASLLGLTSHSIASGRPIDDQRFTNPYVPKIVPIKTLSEGEDQDGGTFLLDGRYSHRDVLKNITLIYGGGSYSMEGAQLSGTTRIELIGAAANTVHFLQQFRFLPEPPVVIPFSDPAPTNKPITIGQPMRTTIHGDFVSPYDGTH